MVGLKSDLAVEIKGTPGLLCRRLLNPVVLQEWAS